MRTIIFGLVLVMVVACSQPEDDLIVGQAIEDDPCTAEYKSVVREVHGIRTVNGQIVQDYRQEILENEQGRITRGFDLDGNVAFEQVIAGEDMYMREGGSDWVEIPGGGLSRTELDKIASSFEENPVDVFCGVQDIVNHKYLGDDVLGKVEVRRFSSEWPEDYLSGSNLGVEFEFLVDGSGLLRRTKMIQTNESFVDEIVIEHTRHDEPMTIEVPKVSR